MQLHYRAKTATGEIVENTIEAIDRFALARDLRSKGNTPLSIEEKKKNVFDVDMIFSSIFGKVKTAELIVLTKNLSGMLRAGLSLARAISVLEKQAKKKSLNKILNSLIDEINAGSLLSDGLAKFPDVFSPLFVSMTRAGEESGNLAGALSEIGANLEKSHALTKKVRGALIYPGVILSAMVVIGILMFAFVVPTLAATFEELEVELPATTRALIFLGNFFSNNLILTFVMIISFVVGIVKLLRAKFMDPYVDFVVVRLPILGTLVKEINTARTARTIASLLVAGVSLSRSTEITEHVVQNIYYKKTLSDTRIAIEKGSPFSQVFLEKPDLYPTMMAEMVQVGEETGKLADMLNQVATFYEDEVENKTKNLSTIIEPILMIVVGAGVGFFALSMITPLYSVLDNIQ
jgi:type II secretory pathway component PulF